LQTLAERERATEAGRVYEGVLARLFEGQSLSSALQQAPGTFPALYVATVRAAERTGDLPEALGRFIAYQSQLDLVRKKISSALIYPVLLVGVGALVTLFLIAYVVPKFSGIYQDMGQSIPWMSQVLLRFGTLIREHGVALLAGLVCLAAAAAYGVRREDFRGWLGRQLWRAPAVGARLKIYHLARYYRTLGMLLRGGIAIAPALGMVSDLLPGALRGQLAGARRLIEEGQPISRAMEASALTTPVAVRMLRVGERTGRMGEMMERIAAFCEDEVGRWIDWFLKLFEPVLMLAIGFVIGVVVLLMYLPVFELAGSIQ
jgi:general secretion pathway protein F